MGAETSNEAESLARGQQAMRDLIAGDIEANRSVIELLSLHVCLTLLCTVRVETLVKDVLDVIQ
jgi:hypothetical protein